MSCMHIGSAIDFTVDVFEDLAAELSNVTEAPPHQVQRESPLYVIQMLISTRAHENRGGLLPWSLGITEAGTVA